MDDPGRQKKEWLDPRLGFETRTEDLQKQPQQGQGNIPGFILKGVVLALAVALLPLLQKQSNVTSYANQTTVARSWEVFSLVVVGLAMCLVVRRANKDKDVDQDNDDGQGTQHYVQKMFDFAGVFDDFKADAVRDKVEIWSSRSQPEEPLVVIAGDRKKEIGEKPILLPVRSLKSSLSNPDVLDFLNDGKVADSKPVQESKNEVRNGELLSVESGNFEEEVDHFLSANVEPAVFPSPIPWACRREMLSGGKEPHQPAPAAENPAPIDGKTVQVKKLPAMPSPIPWHTRPDRTSSDGKEKNASENPTVSEGKPPLVPSQRPPPPPPPPSAFRSPSPRPPPPVSPSPRPSPRSEGLANDGNVEAPPRTPPQKLPFPSPSPSPSRPRNAPVENGSSQKQTNPTVASAKETPTSAVTENGLRAKNGSSQNNYANGDLLRRRDCKDVPNTASSDEIKPRKEAVPSPAPLSPAHSSVFEESTAPAKVLENGVPYRSDSSSKGREGSSQRSDSRSKSRDASSHRSDSRSKSRDASSHRSDSRSKSRDASSHRSDSTSKSRDVSSPSQHSSREVEIDSSVLKQKSKDTDISPRIQCEKSSRKVPSPPPPPPGYADAPLPDPLPPPPPPPLYPGKSTSNPITRQPSVPKDEEHTACFSDDSKHESRATSPPKVVFEVGNSDLESEPELDDSEDHFEASVDEVDKKADQFIANFHAQIRLQRQESMRRSK